MRSGFPDEIRAHGYTRLNIRPAGRPLQLTLETCRRQVEHSSVNFRGWDLPHISRNNNERGSIELSSEFVQGWCDWSYHKEMWRMFRRGQFLHLKALREDLREGVPEEIQGRAIAVGSLIYTITEMFEFTFRMFRGGLYEDGLLINITLGGTANRELWIEDPMRMGFSFPRRTIAESVTVERQLTPSQLSTDSGEASRPAIREMFEPFGWTPSEEQLRSDQQKLFSMRY